MCFAKAFGVNVVWGYEHSGYAARSIPMSADCAKKWALRPTLLETVRGWDIASAGMGGKVG